MTEPHDHRTVETTYPFSSWVSPDFDVISVARVEGAPKMGPAPDGPVSSPS